MTDKIIISARLLEGFAAALRRAEKSEGTVEHYVYALRSLRGYLAGRALSKELLLAWKSDLAAVRRLSTVNAMLAGCNAFLDFCGRSDLHLKAYRFQGRRFRDYQLTDRDVKALVGEARRRHDDQALALLAILEGTGIRVGELRFITVEAVRAGIAVVTLKGKTREVPLDTHLQRLLGAYIRKRRLASGALIRDRHGRPMDRRLVWARLKALCRGTGVDPARVHPHAFRHLFARTFYALTADLAHLADQLGHSSIETTRLYVKTTVRQHLAVLNRVSERLGVSCILLE